MLVGFARFLSYTGANDVTETLSAPARVTVGNRSTAGNYPCEGI